MTTEDVGADEEGGRHSREPHAFDPSRHCSVRMLEALPHDEGIGDRLNRAAEQHAERQSQDPERVRERDSEGECRNYRHRPNDDAPLGPERRIDDVGVGPDERRLCHDQHDQQVHPGTSVVARADPQREKRMVPGERRGANDRDKEPGERQELAAQLDGALDLSLSQHATEARHRRTGREHENAETGAGGVSREDVRRHRGW